MTCLLTILLLQDLQSVYHKNKYYCQSAMVSGGILHVAKHFIFHTDYDDAFEPMLFHLANQTDYKGFVERAGKQDHEIAKQHHVDYSSRPGAAATAKTSLTTSDDQGPTDRAEGSHYDAPPHEGAAGASTAQLDGPKPEPPQKLTTLPPRSSSLPASASKSPANIHGRPGPQQESGGTMFPIPCGSATCVHRHIHLDANTGLDELADEIFSKLERRPKITSKAMSAAVLESIAGVEVILGDEKAAGFPKLKRDVASVSLSSLRPSPRALISNWPRICKMLRPFVHRR